MVARRTTVQNDGEFESNESPTVSSKTNHWLLSLLCFLSKVHESLYLLKFMSISPKTNCLNLIHQLSAFTLVSYWHLSNSMRLWQVKLFPQPAKCGWCTIPCQYSPSLTGWMGPHSSHNNRAEAEGSLMISSLCHYFSAYLLWHRRRLFCPTFPCQLPVAQFIIFILLFYFPISLHFAPLDSLSY